MTSVDARVRAGIRDGTLLEERFDNSPLFVEMVGDAPMDGQRARIARILDYILGVVRDAPEIYEGLKVAIHNEADCMRWWRLMGGSDDNPPPATLGDLHTQIGIRGETAAHRYACIDKIKLPKRREYTSDVAENIATTALMGAGMVPFAADPRQPPLVFVSVLARDNDAKSTMPGVWYDFAGTPDQKVPARLAAFAGVFPGGETSSGDDRAKFQRRLGLSMHFPYPCSDSGGSADAIAYQARCYLEQLKTRRDTSHTANAEEYQAMLVSADTARFVYRNAYHPDEYPPPANILAEGDRRLAFVRQINTERVK
jgi:hypothetical protein